MAAKIRREGLGRLPADTEHLREFVKESRYTRRQDAHTRGYNTRRDRMWCTCSFCLDMQEDVYKHKCNLGKEKKLIGLADFYAERDEKI